MVTFTDQEKRILKRFVGEIKKIRKEIIKNDGKVRETNLSSLIKQSIVEE